MQTIFHEQPNQSQILMETTEKLQRLFQEVMAKRPVEFTAALQAYLDFDPQLASTYETPAKLLSILENSVWSPVIDTTSRSAFIHEYVTKDLLGYTLVSTTTWSSEAETIAVIEAVGGLHRGMQHFLYETREEARQTELLYSDRFMKAYEERRRLTS